jgi:predicted DNA-binding transcriptional regulator AlpA
MVDDNDELISIAEACRLLGGINRSSYYRGVKHGRLPKIAHPSPGVSRVSKRQLLETRERIIAEAGEPMEAA